MARYNPKSVLIVDNATTCAMRLKTLIDVHGAKGHIVHWNDWMDTMSRFLDTPPCLVIIEETVPVFVVELVVESLPYAPLFLLFGKDSIVNWNIDKQVNPLSSRLSNYELMAILEPYWAEEQSINLPSVLILDDFAVSAQKVNSLLTNANIPCQVMQQLYGVDLTEFDMVLVNISDDYERLLQMVKIKNANQYACFILYGAVEHFSGFEFIQKANLIGIDDIVDINCLESQLLGRIEKVWRKSSEFRDEQLVVKQLQGVTEKLLEQSLMLQVLFASSIDGIVAFDETGEIIRANDSFADLVGLELETLTSQNLMTMLNQQSRQDVLQLIKSDYLVQQQIIELRLQHKHNIHIPVSAAVNRINFHGEHVFVAILRNVTSQHLQEKLLVQKNSKLEYDVKNSQKKQKELAAEARMIQRARAAFTAKLSRLVTKGVNIGELANKLTNIEKIMQIEAGELEVEAESVNLHQIINLCLAELTELANAKQVNISILNEDDQVKVWFDPNHLKLALMNIVTNAIEFNLIGGEIHIEVDNLDDQTVLFIKDSGKGILEFRHQSIFDLYQSNLQSEVSLHTGLPLAHSLVYLNEGQLTCENNVQSDRVVGSKFTLMFTQN